MARVKNDRLLTECNECSNGMYVEKSISAIMKNVVECNECGSVKNRFKEKDKKVKVAKVSTKLKELISQREGNWSSVGEGFLGKEHVMDMLDQMENQEVVGEKGHRWLGWAQACIVMAGISSLEEMKEINKGI